MNSVLSERGVGGRVGRILARASPRSYTTRGDGINPVVAGTLARGGCDVTSQPARSSPGLVSAKGSYIFLARPTPPGLRMILFQHEGGC